MADGKGLPKWGPFEIRAKPGEEVCDFCSSQPVYAAYPAADFEMLTPEESILGVGHISKEPWAACEPCSRLIDAGNWKVLLNRACLMFAREFGHCPPDARAMIARCHAKFRENRRLADS